MKGGFWDDIVLVGEERGEGMDWMWCLGDDWVPGCLGFGH